MDAELDVLLAAGAVLVEEELLPEEAIAAFDLWRNTTDKTEY